MTRQLNIVERGTGTPLVLIHGFGIDHRGLLPLDPVFETAGDWQRLYVDLPWTAGTPGDGINSSEDVYALVAEVLAERLGSQPFAVLGQSYGATIARRLAHEFPHTLGLATLVGVFVADHDQRALPPHTVLRSEPAIHGDPLYPDYAELAVAESVPAFEEFKTVHEAVATVDEKAIDRIAAAYGFDQDPEDSHPPYDRPTLILTGRQDHITGYADAWARLDHYPRASFLTLDGGGHAVDVERAPLVRAALTDWLDRLRNQA